MNKYLRYKIMRNLILCLVFVCLTLATYLTNKRYIEKNTQMFDVVSANQNILPFSKITDKQLCIKKKTKSSIPNDAFFEMDAFKSSSIWYTKEIGFGKGDTICLDKISNGSESETGRLAGLTEDKKMLVTIKTDLVKSCANMVVPGTLVNAVIFIEGGAKGEIDEVISFIENPDLEGLMVFDKKDTPSYMGDDSSDKAIPVCITLQIDKGNEKLAKDLVRYNETGCIYLLPIGIETREYLKTIGKK